MQYILIYFALVNLIGAIFVVLDKKKAIKNKWRIPEKHLFLISAIGGGIGVYFTMKKIRHKTLHKRFMIGIPMIIIVQIGLGIYFLGRYINW